MKIFFTLIGTALMCAASGAFAQALDGTWNFNKAGDYSGVDKPRQPQVKTLQITNNKLSLSPRCILILKKEPYYFSGPFQLLLKGGVDESAVNAYISKNFQFKLAGNKGYYAADFDEDCNGFGYDFFVDEDQLLVVNGSTLFYSFKRVVSPKPASNDAGLGPLMSSQLPFNLNAYNSGCLSYWPMKNLTPQSSTKCGPVYSVYIASAKSEDPISKLVASHGYTKNGARYAGEDYDNPGAHGLHPVFTVLPPMKNVIVVRVDDLEGRNDERDVMAGVYLAIKDGKVTDQLNDGCSFDAQYVCSGSNPDRKYKVLETGKFVKIP
jgi:hypothetical protein